MTDGSIETSKDGESQTARRARWMRRLRLTGLALVVLFAAASAFVLAALWSMPPLDAGRAPAPAAFDIAADNGAIVAARGVSRGEYVALGSLPDHLVAAVLAMEDRRFRRHPGIDPKGVARAAWVNLREGEVSQGGSTITQQLAKISYLPADRTFARKAQEAVITLWLEARLSKDEILERYLNNVYLGGGAYGVEAAARRYFGKPARDLALSESAMLAGLIQLPSRTAPTRSYEAAVRRAEVALSAMLDAGVIDQSAADAARAAPARLARPPAEAPIYGYAADFAAAEARGLVGGTGGDFRVETSIDPRLQALAGQVVGEAIAGGGPGGPGQGALIAMTYDGEILAMTGGADYAASEFNRAVHAHRQPGSTFKLFVYLAALQQGFTPETEIDDAPIRIDGYEPRNYSGEFAGRVSVREAFARSLNAAAVRVQEAAGRENVIRVARRLGLEGRLEPEPSLALGAREATLLQLTAAYAALAADRERVVPRMVRRIAAPGGGAFFPPQPEAAPSPWPRNQMLTLLRASVEEGSSRAAGIDGVRVYGKTGTTSDYRDAWFIGFADGLVVGVWLGNDDNSPMRAQVTGGGAPARAWKAFVSAARSGERAAEPRPASGAGELVGAAEVLDTGTLRIEGQLARLEGVDGLGGVHAERMRAYIGDRDVACRPARLESWRCEVGGVDLSEAVIFNGGGRAAADAPGLLKDAERKARQAGRGVWGE